MNVILTEHPVRLVVSEFRMGKGAAVIQHDSAHDSYQYLRSRAMRPGADVELRALLGKLGSRPPWAGEDVMREVAAKVATKQLYLLQIEQEPAGSIDSGATAVSTRAAGKRGPVAALPPLPPPSKSGAGGMAVVTPPDPEPTAALQQEVQAQGLELAAINGTPFCAICEAAKTGSSA